MKAQAPIEMACPCRRTAIRWRSRRPASSRARPPRPSRRARDRRRVGRDVSVGDSARSGSGPVRFQELREQRIVQRRPPNQRRIARVLPQPPGAQRGDVHIFRGVLCYQHVVGEQLGQLVTGHLALEIRRREGKRKRRYRYQTAQSPGGVMECEQMAVESACRVEHHTRRAQRRVG